jgi:hypothetical protein
MTTSTPSNPVTWFEVHTADPDRAKAFYSGVFGWAFDDSIPGYSMIQQGDGAPIGGGILHHGGGMPDDAVFNVQVADVASALAAVKEQGGSVVADAETTPNGITFGYAANPDGSVFGIWCPPGL